MDQLAKSTHFLSVKMTHKVVHIERLLVEEVMRLHGVPSNIVSDRNLKFTLQFSKAFHREMGMELNLSTSNHPKTDGKMERTIQTIEDIIRACIFESSGNWKDHLPLVEFAYNNIYHASIGMASYEDFVWKKMLVAVVLVGSW